MQTYHLPAPGIIRRCKASSMAVCAVPEDRHAEFVTWDEAEIWASEAAFPVHAPEEELPAKLRPRADAEERALQAIAKIGEDPKREGAAKSAIQKGIFDVLFTRDCYNRLATGTHTRRDGKLHWRLQSKTLLLPKKPYSFAAVFLAFSMLREVGANTAADRASLRTHRVIALQMEKDAASPALKEGLRRESDRLTQLLDSVPNDVKSELTFKPGSAGAPRNLTPAETNFTSRKNPG